MKHGCFFKGLNEMDNFGRLEDHCHLLISDIEMPVMDGFHLLKRIRESERLTHLPCIVFSSIITKEQALKCQEVGATDQITKPELDRLVDLVDRHVLKD
jgi:two-component system chemotaxis response regulator CheV